VMVGFTLKNLAHTNDNLTTLYSSKPKFLIQQQQDDR
jgi:hypothetical protein